MNRERLRYLSPAYAAQQEFVDKHRAAIADGKPLDQLRRDAPTWSERFDAQVIEGLDGCLIWDGPTELRATGRVPVIRKGASKKNARLFAMQRAGISVPPARRVVPDCGNARCVRTEHLVVEGLHWSASWSRDEMLHRLRMMADRLGFTPNARRWEAEGGKPALATFKREFEGWDDAVRAAGLPPAQRIRTNQYANVDWERSCRRALLALARKLNRPPFVTDLVREGDWLRANGHPISRNTYYTYLGGGVWRWANVLERAGLR